MFLRYLPGRTCLFTELQGVSTGLWCVPVFILRGFVFALEPLELQK